MLLAAAVCSLLARRFGPWRAVGIFSGAMAVTCVVAALLLRTAPIGRLTWKNRVAGVFLPWGYRISGKLPAITLTSWAVWTAIAVGAAAAMTASARSDAGGASNVWAILLFIGWAVNAAAAFYLFGMIARYSKHAPRSRRPTLMIVAVLLGLIAVSFALNRSGHPRFAAIVSIGPASVIGAIFGAFMLVLTTVGRKVNWH